MKGLVNAVKRAWTWHTKNRDPWPEGEEGLKVRDHRQMVGAKWDALGTLQFRFMIDVAGLTRDDILCDIGCGSFRAGRLFIPYLEEAHYLGLDKQAELVREGRAHEVPADVWQEKRPEIVISDRFEFERFSKRPTKALAQSVFTHLRKGDIHLCLRNLFTFAEAGCVLFATFNETDTPFLYLLRSHSSRRFDYTRSTILHLGEACGWSTEYIGDWGHPLHQKMVKFTKPV